MSKTTKKILMIIICVTSVIAVCFGAFGIYAAIYYHTDEQESEQIIAEFKDVECCEEDRMIFYMPENAEYGVVLVPGGKVEYSAYKPLAAAIASKGFACVIVKVPFNLAVFDMNAPSRALNKFDNVKYWYVGGHSLGGSMAAYYAAKNSDRLEGLIMLGSYSTADIADTDLKVLSVYGGNDKVLNMQKYKEALSAYPESFSEVIIEGGCHSYFGAYGEQKGDGVATVTRAEQIAITAESIYRFIVCE